MSATRENLAPPAGTIERWCFDFITAHTLAQKLAPPAPPDPQVDAHWETLPHDRRFSAPGRPPELRVESRSISAPRPGALARPDARARLLHTFVHHELQAAELFAWALLAFPDTPREFKRGLLRLAQEELGHLHLYAEHMQHLGTRFGDHPVRDWFWQRVVHCPTPASFVAFQGLGLEAANLEHSARFARLFRAAGDPAGAELLERVENDEIAHVAFSLTWFERFTNTPLNYDLWRTTLPPPVTPSLLQGRPLNRPSRLRAGFDAAFLSQLESAPPTGIRKVP
jgi:uncharacterized ferritin-like protein (DUF455 family)